MNLSVYLSACLPINLSFNLITLLFYIYLYINIIELGTFPIFFFFFRYKINGRRRKIKTNFVIIRHPMCLMVEQLQKGITRFLRHLKCICIYIYLTVAVKVKLKHTINYLSYIIYIYLLLYIFLLYFFSSNHIYLFSIYVANRWK